MMIKYLKIALVASLFLLNASQNAAQNPLQDTLPKQFAAYQQAHLQEKVYVHTDRTTYLAGDICWFKLYNVEAFFHTPLSISKIMYVEISDKNNTPVLQAKIPMQDGEGNGSFFVPASTPSGNYTLRAYSNWMKNFNSDYFFEKTLTIINPKAIYEADSIQQKERYTLAFFPEGGNLVEGIDSKVAFHLTNQNGKGVSGQGIVINDKNDTVARLKTLEFGIGSFVFTPRFNEKYKAVVTFNGRQITQALPDAYASGHVMHLAEANNQTLKITVKATATHGSRVYLFAHTRGVVKLATVGKIQDGVATFLVDWNKLGEGISHFTVFSEAQKPVCERLYFKYPNDYLRINLTSDAAIYDCRKQITISTTTTDQTGQPIAASLSMAVYALDSLQKMDEMDIQNYLWLTSDLVGNVESPDFYFKNKDRSAEAAAMDNLMLTHGWRRFRWDDILQKQSQRPTAFSFLPEYVGHLVTGTIKNASTGQNAQNTEGYLTMPSAKKQLHAATSDNTGRVTFDVKDFYHEGRIILQAKGASDSIYSVKIDNPFSEQYTQHRVLPNFVLPSINPTALGQQNVKLQVQNAYFSQKIKQTLDPKIDTTPFYRHPDARYLLDDYVRFLTIEEVLREYVVPVNVRKNNNRFNLHVWDEYTKKFFDDEPLILLDGTPMLEMNKFMGYEPLKIKRLDVISRLYFLNNKAYHGVLNFSTYTNQLTDFEFDPNTVVLDYDGLQKQRVFYAPDYATPQQVQSRLPDFRHLLYWSPTIKTDGKGKTQAQFYSSDRTGKYIVVLQGLTKDGKTGGQVGVFEVKK